MFPVDVIEEVLNSKNVEIELLKLLENDIAREAIFVAAPHLYDSLSKYKDSNEGKRKALLISLLKYIIRMTTRSTPFGLFAGNAIGQFSDNVDMVLDDKNHFKRCTRLDHGYLSRISRNIQTDIGLSEKLWLYTNTSIYNVDDSYRYVETSWDGNNKKYTLQRVSRHELMDYILKKCKIGAQVYDIIENASGYEYGEDSIKTFLQVLIKNQILVTKFDPSVLGNSFIKSVIRHSKKHQEKIVKKLEYLENQINDLDKKITNDINDYYTIFKMECKYMP